jgi:hypothetical protein
MEKRARSLGFTRIEMNEAQYIVVPGYVSRQHARLAPPPGLVKAVAAALPSSFTESLFDWFERSILPLRSHVLEVRK